MTVVVILVICALLIGFFSAFGGCSALTVTSSTVERTPLPSGAVTQTGYYTDEDGSFIANPSVLNSGMRSFYQDTGVQPYLYILPNGRITDTAKLASYAEELYGKMFEDTAHFLVVFCDDGRGSYHVGYYIGAQAGTVVDDEAMQIFSNYLEINYYSDKTDSQMFADTFQQTGERIMSITPPYLLIGFAIMCVLIALIAVLLFVKLRRDQKEREQKRMQDILSTPLETFGNKDLEDLEKKYS